MKYPLLLVSILLLKAVFIEASLKSTPQLKDSITLVDAQAGSHIRAFSVILLKKLEVNKSRQIGGQVSIQIPFY